MAEIDKRIKFVLYFSLVKDITSLLNRLFLGIPPHPPLVLLWVNSFPLQFQSHLEYFNTKMGSGYFKSQSNSKITSLLKYYLKLMVDHSPSPDKSQCSRCKMGHSSQFYFAFNGTYGTHFKTDSGWKCYSNLLYQVSTASWLKEKRNNI